MQQAVVDKRLKAGGSSSEQVYATAQARWQAKIDSLEKARELKVNNKINIITPAEITQLSGAEKLESIVVTKDKVQTEIALDHFIPLFGLSPRLGPIGNWGLEIEKNAIKVDTFDYQTNIPGIFAIGDINTYPGKLKLILCGFHEATLMCQSAFKIINPGKKNIFRYIFKISRFVK